MFMQKTESIRILILAIGNSGRSDDGAGWMFGEMIEKMNFRDVSVEYRYQLQVEDASLIGQYDVVIFADATQDKTAKGFGLNRCLPAKNYPYTTHQQSPETILYLAGELYNAHTRAWVLAISGHQWDHGEQLSVQAQRNVNRAFLSIKKTLTGLRETILC